MKNFKVIPILALTFLFVCGVVSAVSAKSDFRIHNETRYTMTRIYVCPNGRSYSSQQNSHAIPSGKTFVLGNLPVSRSDKYWNIKIVLSNGKSYEWKKENLYSHDDMTIYFKGSRIYADWN
ncbi:MAG: hypothetical protein IKZ58_05285 [Selenomonadaceae bacterium]|nr:hypothetical protein [Selenomonadaceae bacterium]